MSRPAELGLAVVVAAAGIAAMVWWPAGEGLDASDPVDMPDEASGPELPADGEPQPDGADDVPPQADDEAEPGPEPEVVDESGDAFAFMPPGELLPDSGTGLTQQINYAPAMRFPMELGQAYANSQVYGHGGFHGPEGGQCDGENYAYAWRDNFCETRGHSTPLCPAGTGHQGQDIRPASCADASHWAVAAADGTITSVGSYSVRLMSDDGLRFTYLHLDSDSLVVEPGDVVSRGDRLGLVSNEFGGNATTIHLHFEVKIAVNTPAGLQNTHVPPYLALVDSYQRLLTGTDSSQG
ncbi:M23 family metallopeptidase [Marinicauda pacifica]|nr:M23 family metallopeptidase [Marinicauda pacifica]